MLIFKSVGFKSSEAVNVKILGAKVKSRTTSDISGQRYAELMYFCKGFGRE